MKDQDEQDKKEEKLICVSVLLPESLYKKLRMKAAQMPSDSKRKSAGGFTRGLVADHFGVKKG